MVTLEALSTNFRQTTLEGHSQSHLTIQLEIEVA